MTFMLESKVQIINSDSKHQKPINKPNNFDIPGVVQDCYINKQTHVNTSFTPPFSPPLKCPLPLPPAKT